MNDISRGVKMTVLEYKKGRNHNGTFVIMGIVGTLDFNDVAIVGRMGNYKVPMDMPSFPSLEKHPTMSTPSIIKPTSFRTIKIIFIICLYT